MTTKDNNQSRNSKALKSGIWYTISSVSVKAILILTTPVFTRLMSTSEYGISATFSTWFALLNVICSLNLWYSVGRAKIDYKDDFERFVGCMQVLAFIFTIIIGFIAFPLISEISKLLGLSVSLTIALYLYLLFYPAIQLTQSKYKYLYNYKGNIKITIYTTLSTVFLSLLLLLVLKDKALGKSLGAVVSAIFLSLIFWINTFKNKNICLKKEYCVYALKISVPLILNSISLNILSQADRIFINNFCGPDYTGIYSLTYSYAILINLILNSINEAWLPWFHDTFNDKLYEEIKQKVKPIVIFGCFVGIGCIALAPEAIQILGGENYAIGVWVVPPVTLGIICNYIFQHYEHIELHLKQTWYISVCTILAAVLNIILNYIFVKKFGFIAAAYTTLFCYLVLMILHNLICKKILKYNIYDDKFMYFSLIITSLIAIIFSVLYNYYFIYRWILLLIVMLLYFVTNKKFILNVIQKFLKK